MRKSTRLALLLAWFSSFSPLLLYGLVRVSPGTFLSEVAECRQVRAPLEIIATDEHRVCAAVLGASTGIGKELATLLGHKVGVRLIVSARTRNRVIQSLASVNNSIVQASGLDLDDAANVAEFGAQLANTVSTHCGRHLDFLFLNAAQGYSDDYQGSYASKDGQHDRLLFANFISYSNLLADLMTRLTLSSTRVVFVSSIAHYTGVVQDIFEPNVLVNPGSIEKLTAYSTSKLALSTMQHILAREGIIPNSVAVSSFQNCALRDHD
jgi:NAD(P)-dependent dehydrogenase (short-subunit alcohol dehydrogenase family)